VISAFPTPETTGAALAGPAPARPCACCTPWQLPHALRPQRIRELAASGLHPQAIAIVCGVGTLEVEAALRGES